MVCYGIFWSGQLVSQLRACLHGSGGPQVGETTRLGGANKITPRGARFQAY